MTSVTPQVTPSLVNCPRWISFGVRGERRLPRLRTYLAVAGGRSARLASRLARAGSGTTLPGLVAERLDPAIIAELAASLPQGTVVITGTNGKTTTAKMLAEILATAGLRVLANTSGSNLTRGVASALVAAARFPSLAAGADIGVFEIDEATMAGAVPRLHPRLVVVTNLFRDQLDRYGELDKTASIIEGSLAGERGTVLLNADDPLVASVGGSSAGDVRHFGIEDRSISTTSTSAMDTKDCIVCGHEYDYATRYFGHLGLWSCPSCGARRPSPAATALDIRLGPSASDFVYSGASSFDAHLGVPGLYNVYNALAAAAAAEALGVEAEAIKSALGSFSAAFGRMEHVRVDDTSALLLLVKNPTGANQALAAALSEERPRVVVFALNDNFADGTDVSWIWDVDFEELDLNRLTFVASGIRAEDIAVRLKYAGLPAERLHVERDPIAACKLGASLVPAHDELVVLPTYTAMMEIRSAYAPEGDDLTGLGAATKRGL